MTDTKKTEATVSDQAPAPSVARKPPRKLVPRPAPKAAVAATDAVVKPAVKRVAKVDLELEATNARNKKAMSEALAKAQAVKIAQPLGRPLPPPDLPKSKKPAKVAKAKKVKLVRDSYAMPEPEYAAIAALKKRLLELGSEFKKSEVLRAGIAALVALNDAELMAVMGRVERIKTGRPGK